MLKIECSRKRSTTSKPSPGRKPNAKESHRGFAIDLHVHSDQSADGHFKVRELALAAKKKGLDAIAVCDHDVLTKVEANERRISGVLVLAGEEVSTKEGHACVLGVKKAFPKGIPAKELIRQVKKAGGVCIAAHPFALLHQFSLGEKARHLGFTALERYNGRSYTNNLISQAKRIRGTGGSDAHWLEEVGNAYTVVGVKPGAGEKEILAALKKGKFTARWQTRFSSQVKRWERKILRKG